MIAIPPKQPHEGGVRVVFAANQREYDPLPAVVDRDGVVMTEFEFTAEELATVLAGGRLRLWLYTFNRPLQPIALEIVE